MLSSAFGYRAWRILLISGAALPLALACGSDDDKIVTPGGESGAAGAAEAGAPSAGGTGVVAGAPSEPSAGQSPGGASGTGGTGAAGEQALGGTGGDREDGAGGAPISECVPGGSVTGLDVGSDAIYQGCRGGVVRALFDVDDASGTFQCCGLSTPTPTLAVPVLGEYDFDGGVRLSFEVPSDAAPGSYGLSLECPTTTGEQIINVEINEGLAPSILSISEVVTPSGVMNIKGNGLANVGEVRGVRASDRRYWVCEIDTQTATEINCTMPGDLQLSENQDDLYFIDVLDDDCGAAANPPPFTVVD